jgi:hypothetical protein
MLSAPLSKRFGASMSRRSSASQSPPESRTPASFPLRKRVRFSGERALNLRLEAFNAFNHTQFYGPAEVDGQVEDTQNFGKIVSAASPRLMQLAAKFSF